MNTNMYIYTYRYIYMCVYVCVCLFFVVWCRVMSCVARRGWLGGWVWCGVVDVSLSWWSLSLCRGPFHCSRHRKIRKKKKKEQERNGAKAAEQIV